MSCGDSVVVDGEAVYVAFSRRLYAISRSSGEVLWQRDEDSWMSQPVVADGNIYLLARDEETGGNYVRSLDSSTGTLNWQQLVDGQVRSPTEVYGGSVYLTVNHWVDGRAEYGTLLSLDASTGVPNWEYRVDKWISTIPVVSDDNIYFGTYTYPTVDDYLYAIEPRSGELIRQYDASGGSYDTPLVADGNAYIVSGWGSLRSIDLGTGTTNWEYWPEGRASGTPMLADGSVYFRVYDPREREYLSVYALDATTGSLEWLYKPGEAVKQPTASNGSVFVPSYNRLVSLDGLTGNLDWQAGYGDTCGPLIAADGVLYGRTIYNNRYLVLSIRTRY